VGGIQSQRDRGVADGSACGCHELSGNLAGVSRQCGEEGKGEGKNLAGLHRGCVFSRNKKGRARRPGLRFESCYFLRRAGVTGSPNEPGRGCWIRPWTAPCVQKESAG